MFQYSYLLILHNTFDIIFKILCREENWDSDLIMNSGHITRKTKACCPNFDICIAYLLEFLMCTGITFRLLKLTYWSKKNKPEAKDKYLKLYLPCSSSNTSFHPSLARWYATEQPTIPPPQTTTCASFGTDEFELSPSWELEFLFAWRMEDDKSLPGLI